MAIPTVEAVAQAIANVIKTTVVIPGSSPSEFLRATDYLADTFSVPCLLVAENGRPDVHANMGGGSIYEYLLWLILPRAADRSQLQAMELYASPTGTSSVQAALEADQSLGGVCAAGIITKIGGPVNVSVNGNPFIARAFTYQCLASS